MESRYEQEWEQRMNPRWRGKGRGAKKRAFQGNRCEETEASDTRAHQGRNDPDGERPRHPPGLRGRAIGLWYSQQNRGKKDNAARNEDYKNRAFITMDRHQERKISDLLQSIQSSEIAGQNPRSYRAPSPPSDDRDDSDKVDLKSDDVREDKDFRSDRVGKQDPMSCKTKPSETESSSVTSNLNCFDFFHIDRTGFRPQEIGLKSDDVKEEKVLRAYRVGKQSPMSCKTKPSEGKSSYATANLDRFDSIYTNRTCFRPQEIGPMCSMNDIDYWDMNEQKVGTRSSKAMLKSPATEEKPKDFVGLPLAFKKKVDEVDDDALAFEKEVDEDDDDEEKFDEEFDDFTENVYMNNFEEEDFDERRGTEEDLTEEEDDAVSPIKFNCEEEENSSFMFEFYKNLEGNGAESPKQRRDYHSLARNRDLDQTLINQQRSKGSHSTYQRMREWRQKLPCFAKKQEILDAINRNQVVVISGETGCGKTTQVTQFILDSWIEKGDGSLCRVVCTQPRRISAITIAERVAGERVEALGTSVGYQIRLEQKLPRDQGSILYCTTGIMLKWLESDPWLAKTSHIILDEVHERDILCDFLMVILRDLIQQRRDLKLILMSATLNANMFSEYFGNCPMIHVPGYTFPVKEFFLEDVIEMIHFVPNKPPRQKPYFRFGEKNKKEERQRMDEYQQWVSQLNFKKYSRSTIDVLRTLTFDSNEIDYDLVTALIHHVVLNRPDGAILVFVPGWEHIRKVIDSLSAQAIFSSSKFRIIPLHSLMPTMNQREVFERPPLGMRKIIVATNIAETSITIDDVVYVIDCGTMKLKKFDVAHNLSTLQPEWISRANAKQRRGRAGRVCPGECFHLFTTFHESRLDDYLQPEMLRTRLEELCLQIKLLKLGKIKEFVSKAMQPPSMDSLDLAIQLLRDLNALTSDEELTPLGFHLAKMPVDPHSGKMLLFAALFSCLDPILTVAASLSFKDAFYVPLGHEKTADERKRQLANKTKSDHLLLINAYEGWERAKANRDVYNYCRYNYLSTSTLQMLQSMRRQFSQLLFDMGFIVSSDPKSSDSNRNTGNVNLIKAIVCAGLYPNVARLKPLKTIHSKRPLTLHTKCDQKVSVHPKSVIFAEREFSSQWFVYHLKMKTKQIYLYDCSPVSPYALLFFGGDITCRKDLGGNCIVVDDWIKFGASRRVATLVQELRHEFDQLMERRITNPCATNWCRRTQEGALMHAILDLLMTDDSFTPKQSNWGN